MPVRHRLDASAQTVHWGYFDAALAPRIEIDSGDTITISTVSGPREMMPPPPLVVPPALAEVQAKLTPRLPGHMCTGPVAVRGAKAGQVLEVKIDAIDLHYDWGYTYSRPLTGALPDDFPALDLMHTTLDRETLTARLPWGLELPLRPFFGVMAVAPPAAWGAVSTLPPRRNGGNLDNKELVAGTTLYLPIHVDGAQFSVGDGHGVQGDGEVCVTAIETGLIDTITLTVRDDVTLAGRTPEWPLAETPTHHLTMAFDPDLDQCVVLALRQMVDVIADRTGVTRQQAYMLCSLAADVRVTQVVNGNKGAHVMIEKRWLATRT